MAEQLPLITNGRFVDAELWRRLLGACGAAVTRLTHKEACHVLDVAPSSLSNALVERDGKTVRGPWIVTLAREDSERHGAYDIPQIVAECAGGSFVPNPKLTAEQRLDRIERALERLPEHLRAAILLDAGLKR